VPNEFLEAYFPLRIREYATIVDSGGAGLHRGGNGITIAYEMLEAGEFSIHDDRWLTYPWGVNGGEPGMRSTKRLVRVDPGDVLHFNTWGGGGWGDPLQRDAQLVAADVARGLVSQEGAKRYGVVITNGVIDEAATSRLREQLSIY